MGDLHKCPCLESTEVTEGTDRHGATEKRRGGLDPSEEARVVLRQLIPDRIRLSPKVDGSLWAHSALQPAALLVATVCFRAHRLQVIPDT